MQNNVPNDDIETRERKEILQKLNEIQEEFLEMRNNMSNLSASINTNDEGTPDKFATVVSCQMLLSFAVKSIPRVKSPEFPLSNRLTA